MVVGVYRGLEIGTLNIVEKDNDEKLFTKVMNTSLSGKPQYCLLQIFVFEMLNDYLLCIGRLINC